MEKFTHLIIPRICRLNQDIGISLVVVSKIDGGNPLEYNYIG